MLTSLTYLSHATEPLDTPDLVALLEVSRSRNDESGVTGLLLYTQRQFIQVLEGEEVDVMATMARIRADHRHRDVDVTLVETIERRRFASWSMGFRSVTSEQAEELEAFTDYLEPGSAAYEETMRWGRAGKFLRIFRDTMRSDL